MAVVIVDSLLVERLAEALHDAAVHLAIDQQRIDDDAAIVHGDVALDLDLAGIAIDFRHDDVGAEGEGEVGRLPEVRRHQARLGIGRQLHGAIGRAGDFGQRHRLAGLVADAHAAGESDVVRFEQHLAELLDLGFEILQGVV